MNQVEERALYGHALQTRQLVKFLTFSDNRQFAVTQIRSRRGGRERRGLVAVDASDQFRTLCRSPRKKRRERRFPEAGKSISKILGAVGWKKQRRQDCPKMRFRPHHNLILRCGAAGTHALPQEVGSDSKSRISLVD